MKVIVIKNCHYAFNDYDYQKGEIIYVKDLGQFENDYAIYYEDTMDWIPKDSVEIITNET